MSWRRLFNSDDDYEFRVVSSRWLTEWITASFTRLVAVSALVGGVFGLALLSLGKDPISAVDVLAAVPTSILLFGVLFYIWPKLFRSR